MRQLNPNSSLTVLYNNPYMMVQGFPFHSILIKKTFLSKKNNKSVSVGFVSF